MMVFREERLFTTDKKINYNCELNLQFLGKDTKGFKMHGIFPNVWKKDENGLSGPSLVDEESVYHIEDIDYNKGYIWLTPTNG